ncbi:copper-binding protein [Pseudomonas guineae]|uniref:copper-binding protein n=1 Tax=Pseudomonas guineae TaxID=425504 RepID=UPI003CFC2FD8
MKKLLNAIAMVGMLSGTAFTTVQAAETASSNAVAMSQAEVRKIDSANQKITLRHGPLANLGMPPMTMVFTVQDATQLEGLNVGDKVQFVAQQQGSQFVATELQPAQ